MKSATVLPLLASLSMFPGFSQAVEPPKAEAPKPAAGVPRELNWDDLLPAAELNLPPPSRPAVRPLFDDESGPAAGQQGSANVNASLNGQTVKLPGFVVPLAIDAGSRVGEFLLVPYFGACMHIPPPPPNQIVHVTMKPPVTMESIYDPVWVIGKLSTQGVNSQLASAAYSIAGVKIEKYEY